MALLILLNGENPKFREALFMRVFSGRPTLNAPFVGEPIGDW